MNKKPICLTCCGSGEIEHLLWSEYFNKVKVKKIKHSAEAIQRFFDYKGFNANEIPDYLIPCPDCDPLNVCKRVWEGPKKKATSIPVHIAEAKLNLLAKKRQFRSELKNRILNIHAVP